MNQYVWILAISCIQICAGWRAHKKRSPSMEGYIVGGVEVDIEQYPHTALITMYGQVYCGGAVVSDRVILTAAHCVYNPEGLPIDPINVIVQLGSSNPYRGKKYEPCEMLPHPKYNPDQNDYFYFYDIGLILLRTKIKFGRTVQKAKLVPHGRWRKTKYTMTVAGFGLTSSDGESSDNLKMTRMRYVDHETCNRSQTNDGRVMPVPAHMFCMIADKWTSDCYGDSGSGIIWRGLLVGLVSTGRDTECGSETIPSMYTDVTYFRDWIQHNIETLETRTIGTCQKTKSKLMFKNEFEEKRNFEIIHHTGNDVLYNWFGGGFIPRLLL